MRAFQVSALGDTAVRDERERGIIRSKALEEAARQALEALCLPCSRWNGTQSKIVNDAIEALRAALAGGNDA